MRGFAGGGADISDNDKQKVMPYEMPSMDKIKPTTNALDNWLQKYNEPTSICIVCKVGWC